MVILGLDPLKCPRTWTRQQWKESYRYMRVLNKLVNIEMEKRREAMTEEWINLMAYGTTHPHLGKQ